MDAKNTEQDEKLNAIENKFPSYVKKTDVDSTLSVAGSPADAKVVGDSLKNEKQRDRLKLMLSARESMMSIQISF